MYTQCVAELRAAGRPKAQSVVCAELADLRQGNSGGTIIGLHLPGAREGKSDRDCAPDCS